MRAGEYSVFSLGLIASLAMTALAPTLLFSGCGKHSSPTSVVGGGVVEQDDTEAALPEFTGTFVSPAAHFRIYDNARFNLRTWNEQVHWAPGKGAAEQQQHYARCDILRAGTVQLVQHDGKRFIKLNIQERTVVSSARDERSPDDNATLETCRKAVSILAVSTPLHIWVSSQAKNQFLISSDPGEKAAETLRLEVAAQGETLADSHLNGEFAMLFTPFGQATDVTDLVAPSLAAAFSATQDNAHPDHLNFELDPIHRTLHFANRECQVDAVVRIAVISYGRHIALRAIHTGSPAATAATSSSSSLEASKPTNGQPLEPSSTAIDPCTNLRSAMSAESDQEIFDLTDPGTVAGLGGLRGLRFRKTGPSHW